MALKNSLSIPLPKTNFKALKANFLDRDAVVKEVERSKRRGLGAQGQAVRRKARKSLKTPKTSFGRDSKGRFANGRMAHLPPAEQKKWKQRQAIARRKGEKIPWPAAPRVKPRPGKPPHDYTGLLKKIFYAYDKTTDSVPVGPLAFDKGQAWLLEHGGTATVTNSDGERVRATYRKFPFMTPALEQLSSSGELARAYRRAVTK